MNTKLFLSVLVAILFLNNVAQSQQVDFITFFGNYKDGGFSIVTDKLGFIYVAGNTSNASFPVTVGALSTVYKGGNDAFVAKLSPDGKEVVYSTFIGGTGREHHCSIAIDDSGYVYMAGGTESSDFPVTDGAYDKTFNGKGDWAGDVYVLKLNPSGNKLIYSTFLGGNSNDVSLQLCVDKNGNAYVSGTTTSTNFPTSVGAYMTAKKGVIEDVFVAKINPDGTQLVYSTLIGGKGMDVGQSIVLDNTGNVFIGGLTNSTDFSNTGGASNANNFDAFVVKLNNLGSELLFTNIFGGSSTDRVDDMCMGSNGSIYVSGFTQSSNFVCSDNALSKTYKGKGSESGDWYGDAFLVKINPESGITEYSSFIGGTNGEIGVGVISPVNDLVYILGNTYSSDFPVSNDSKYKGNGDMFLTAIDLKTNQIKYTNYIGGKSLDETWGGLAADSVGNIILIGSTSSSDITATPGTVDTTYNGAKSYFIMKYKTVSTGIGQIYHTGKEGILNIFPNPNSGIFSILLETSYLKQAKAEVYNTDGRLVLSKEINGTSSEIFDITGYPNGIYLFTLNIDGSVYTAKISNGL